jgi:hypothetical protein
LRSTTDNPSSARPASWEDPSVSTERPVLRAYRPDDLAAATRIWREVRWIDGTDEQATGLEQLLGAGDTVVAELDGEVESVVHRCGGTLRHQDADLPLTAITAVITSLVGRRAGLASRLTATAVAEAAGAGAAFATLGMFEQGFYDRIGFGSGPYEHRVTVDPARLDVPVPYRRPVRLTADDADDIHAALVHRARTHGGIVLDDPELLRAEMAWTEGVLALGYRDDAGELTHCIMGSLAGEHGPLTIKAQAYRDTAQLLELLRLLQELSAQMTAVRIFEPPEVQLADLVHQPLRQLDHTPGNERYVWTVDAFPWWQARILDLGRCIGALRAVGEPIRCNLVVHDPAPDLADGWSGVGGTYTLTVDDPSSIDEGATDGLPTLTASVGALTRWWLGVGSATRLAATDALDGPPDLLAALDRAVRLPTPFPGWDH